MQMQLLCFSFAGAALALFIGSPADPSSFGTDIGRGTEAPPTCNSGGPYNVECTGNPTVIPMNGSGADADGDPVTFQWFEECPFGFFDDPSDPQTNFNMPMTGECEVSCFVTLRTFAKGEQTNCTTTVAVEDTTPPTFDFCPPDITVPFGSPTDPSVTGTATASDICHGAITPTKSDGAPTTNPDGSTSFARTWTANDGCDSRNCEQIITVEGAPEEGEADFDIKPGSCPNPVNVDSNGVIPAALVGAPGFDVTDVDTDTLRLVRHDGVGGSVAPARLAYADVATEFAEDEETCDCHTLTSDGTLDLAMKFVKQDVVSALQLGSVANGTFLRLDLTGELEDGTAFTVTDCIRIINH